MPKPKCTLCESRSFEMNLARIDDCLFNLIQCCNCKGVVAAMDHESALEYLRVIFQKLEDMDRRLKEVGI